MSAWRQAGLNYVNYSQIAARLLRQALKADLRAEAVKRDDSNVKFTQWKDGKPVSKYRDSMGWDHSFKEKPHKITVPAAS